MLNIRNLFSSRTPSRKPAHGDSAEIVEIILDPALGPRRPPSASADPSHDAPVLVTRMIPGDPASVGVCNSADGESSPPAEHSAESFEVKSAIDAPKKKRQSARKVQQLKAALHKPTVGAKREKVPSKRGRSLSMMPGAWTLPEARPVVMRCGDATDGAESEDLESDALSAPAI